MSSMADAVVVEDDGRVRTLTLNRPEALNAMNNDVFCGIRDALAAAEDDPGTAVVMITGAGRAYCAGLDLAAASDPNAGTDQFPTMLHRLASFRKPLIAAVNGIGVGIGMTMLAHCDLVLMSSEARLRTPFPQLGLAPEAGSSYTFTALMGWQNAAYTLLSGRWFSAEECVAMGLAWRVCAPEKLLAEAAEVASEIAANPIPSLISTKDLMLAAGREQGALDAHERELRAYEPLMGGPANVEAFRAFSEKREPDFGSIEGL